MQAHNFVLARVDSVVYSLGSYVLYIPLVFTQVAYQGLLAHTNQTRTKRFVEKVNHHMGMEDTGNEMIVTRWTK